MNRKNKTLLHHCNSFERLDDLVFERYQSQKKLIKCTIMPISIFAEEGIKIMSPHKRAKGNPLRDKTAQSMKRLCTLISVLPVLACGRESKLSNDGNSSDRETEMKADILQSFQVSALDRLPECTLNREGSLAYIKNTNEFRTCDNGKWDVIEIRSSNKSTENQTCRIEKSGAQSSINCGTDSVVIRDGLSADGAACSVAKTASVSTINCGNSSVTINDGEQGPQGIQGNTGSGCLVQKSGGTATVVCGGQSIQIVDGTDGQSCSVSKVGSTATVTCGTQVVTINDGIQGTQGPAGSDAVWAKITDAAGTKLGTWIPFSDGFNYSMGLMLDDGKMMGILPSGEWYATPAQAVNTNFLSTLSTVYFSTVDCSGNPFATTGKVFKNGILPTPNGWKVSTGSEVFQTFIRRSSFNRNGCTQTSEIELSGWEYTEPYTLPISWPISGPINIVRSN